MNYVNKSQIKFFEENHSTSDTCYLDIFSQINISNFKY